MDENITITHKFNLWVWLRFQLAALLGRSKPLNIISTFEIHTPDDPTRPTCAAPDAFPTDGTSASDQPGKAPAIHIDDAGFYAGGGFGNFPTGVSCLEIARYKTSGAAWGTDEPQQDAPQ